MNRKLLFGIGAIAAVAIAVFIILLVTANSDSSDAVTAPVDSVTAPVDPVTAPVDPVAPVVCDYTLNTYGSTGSTGSLSYLTPLQYNCDDPHSDACYAFNAGISFDDAIKLHARNGIWYYDDIPTGVVYSSTTCDMSAKDPACIDSACINCANDCGFLNMIGSRQSQFNEVAKFLKQ